jgi:hypothetical protein
MPPGNAGSDCGAYNSGTVDSREKVRPGTGREPGLGQAVGERTGRYSQRVPVVFVCPAATYPAARAGWLDFRGIRNKIQLEAAGGQLSRRQPKNGYKLLK